MESLGGFDLVSTYSFVQQRILTASNLHVRARHSHAAKGFDRQQLEPFARRRPTTFDVDSCMEAHAKYLYAYDLALVGVYSRRERVQYMYIVLWFREATEDFVVFESPNRHQSQARRVQSE